MDFSDYGVRDDAGNIVLPPPQERSGDGLLSRLFSFGGGDEAAPGSADRRGRSVDGPDDNSDSGGLFSGVQDFAANAVARQIPGHGSLFEMQEGRPKLTGLGAFLAAGAAAFLAYRLMR